MSNETKISDLFGYKPDRKKYKESTKLVTNEHAVGVECEIENIDYDFETESPNEFNRYNLRDLTCDIDAIPDLSPYWLIVKDNSLRKGVEFIFNGPLVGINIEEALNKMQAFYNIHERLGESPTVSHRTSVHVHLDIKDLNEGQLNNLILLYILIERILFKYVEPARLKNNYCRPLTDSSFKNVLVDLRRSASSQLGSSLPDIIRGYCDKYSGLNLLPIVSYGSIEFRHHQGTTDMSEVLDWINIILSLKVTALSTDIRKFLSDFEQEENIKNILSEIFKGSKLGDLEFLETIPLLNELFLKGYIDVIEVLEVGELSRLSSLKKKRKIADESNLLYKFAEINKITIKKEELLKRPTAQYSGDDILLTTGAQITPFWKNYIAAITQTPSISPVFSTEEAVEEPIEAPVMANPSFASLIQNGVFNASTS